MSPLGTRLTHTQTQYTMLFAWALLGRANGDRPFLAYLNKFSINSAHFHTPLSFIDRKTSSNSLLYRYKTFNFPFFLEPCTTNSHLIKCNSSRCDERSPRNIHIYTLLQMGFGKMANRHWRSYANHIYSKMKAHDSYSGTWNLVFKIQNVSMFNLLEQQIRCWMPRIGFANCFICVVMN